MSKTIIYYTDHRVKEPLFTACQKQLVRAAEGRPIVSVSHRPIDLGHNIAIGRKKSSWLLLYKQLLVGVENAKTKYVAMAEHDCLYPPGHYDFVPPRDDTFYYNENALFVQWSDDNHPELKGMYSRWPKRRLALSAMTCNRDLLLETLNERLDLLDQDREMVRDIVFAGEPGLSKLRSEESKRVRQRAQRWAKSGRPVYLKQFMKEQLDKEKYDIFHTEIPYLDVRHESNFTGPRRGRRRTFEVPFWGKFEEVINGNKIDHT